MFTKLKLRKLRKKQIKEYAKCIIECEEESQLSPDESDWIHSAADWGVDLAKLFISPKKEKEIRAIVRERNVGY